MKLAFGAEFNGPNYMNTGFGRLLSNILFSWFGATSAEDKF